MNTDQWARPWPDREGRDARVRQGLERGETWIVWDGDAPAATMTIYSTTNTALHAYYADTARLRVSRREQRAY